ncbi:MAG TPA: acyltransferase [Thermoleophilaceae bacterium]
MRPQRFIAGDPLRALAALSVLVYHAAFLARDPVPASWTEAGAAYGDVLTHGLAALDAGLFVFFVLSGYLIGGPFVRAFVEGRPLPRIGGYLRNRALRIVPAFWAVVTVVLVVEAGADSSPGEIAAIYLFAQSFDLSEAASYVGQAWTLHTEVAFYLLVPLVAWLGARAAGSRLDESARRRLVLLLCAAVFTSTLALSEELHPALGANEGPFEDRAWQTSIAAMAWAFVPGVVLATLEPVLAPRVRGRNGGRLALALAAAGLVALALYAATGDLAAFPPRPGLGSRLLLTFGAGALVAAPLVLQWSEGRAWRVLDNRPLHWLGERSYGIYLVHQAILLEMAGWSLLAGHARPHFLLVLATALALTIPASALLHRLVERPALDLRARWKLESRASTPTP